MQKKVSSIKTLTETPKKVTQTSTHKEITNSKLEKVYLDNKNYLLSFQEIEEFLSSKVDF